MRNLIGAVAGVLAALALAGGASAAPPICKVTGPTATPYLFGAIHLMSADTA